jgi:hypothetical protein
LLKTKGNLQGDPINKPVNTRDTAGTGTVCHGVPKIKTVPVPTLPVLETPRVFLYPCRTLATLVLMEIFASAHIAKSFNFVEMGKLARNHIHTSHTTPHSIRWQQEIVQEDEVLSTWVQAHTRQSEGCV